MLRPVRRIINRVTYSLDERALSRVRIRLDAFVLCPVELAPRGDILLNKDRQEDGNGQGQLEQNME